MAKKGLSKLWPRPWVQVVCYVQLKWRYCTQSGIVYYTPSEWAVSTFNRPRPQYLHQRAPVDAALHRCGRRPLLWCAATTSERPPVCNTPCIPGVGDVSAWSQFPSSCITGSDYTGWRPAGDSTLSPTVRSERLRPFNLQSAAIQPCMLITGALVLVYLDGLRELMEHIRGSTLRWWFTGPSTASRLCACFIRVSSTPCYHDLVVLSFHTPPLSTVSDRAFPIAEAISSWTVFRRMSPQVPPYLYSVPVLKRFCLRHRF